MSIEITFSCRVVGLEDGSVKLWLRMADAEELGPFLLDCEHADELGALIERASKLLAESQNPAARTIEPHFTADETPQPRRAITDPFALKPKAR